MGGEEKDRRAPTPPLFDSIPKQLIEDEQHIKATYDGTIGSDGIIMILNPITGIPIRVTFIDLFGQKDNVTFEPLHRAKWASRKRDIKPESKEYAKLDVIEEAVKAKWKEWRMANQHHLPIREFKASLFSGIVQVPIQPIQPVSTTETKIVFEEELRLPTVDLVVYSTPDIRRGFIQSPEEPVLIHSQLASGDELYPEVAERSDRIRDAVWEKYLIEEAKRHHRHKKQEYK